MSGIDNKKVKRRKMKKGAVTKAATPTKSSTLSEVPLTRAELNGEALKNLEKLMDAPDDDSTFKMLSFSRGANPFLQSHVDRERCLLCNCERQDPPEADTIKNESTDEHSVENNPLAQLPLWVCPSCRKAADQEMEKKPSLEQFLDTDGDSFLPDISIKSGSEPTTPNGSICTCDACTERRKSCSSKNESDGTESPIPWDWEMIESEHELETADLQKSWTELRKVVRCLYGNRDDTNNTEELNVNRLPSDEHITDLVHTLCSRDPHQLFLRLESQVREFVIEMKVKLLKQLSTGFKTPPQAKKFISLMLEEYAHICKVARKMAGLLKELQNHLKRFKVTWDLHNKHLFQSIVFSEPSIKNSLNLLIQQLRLGAASKESYTEDTYPNLLHRYLKFEDEMSVINVVWRDCHQLIESYNEEQSALKLKQKMLREDWEFFKTQRKLLEQQVSKNPKASLSHNLEAQFTETMRLMLQGNKPSQDELTCPRCNRKRCPCDECTITHMITCGIINPDVLDSSTAPNPLTSHHNANFMHDPNRYRIDVSPPSMSSTTSSSGSSSPIMVDPERLNLPFQDDHARTDEEIQEEIDNQSSDNDDDEDDDDDDGVEDDGAEDADNEEEDGENLEKPPNINDLPLKGMVEITGIPALSLEEEMRRPDFGKVESCNCDHCVSQAKLEQVVKPEDNQCQCHVCLQQQGKAISTTLPQHIPPIVPRPGELHLYPHIHGSTGLHSLGRGHVRPILQPNLYDLHLPNQRHKSIIQQTKVPIKLDFDSPEGINDHIYHAYGDWDNTYDPRLLLGSGKFDSELLPPPPFSSPYTSTLLTEPLNLPGMFSTSSSLPVSTSPASSAFVSTMANFTSSVAATQTATKITDNLSVLTTKELLGEQLANRHNQCSNQSTTVPNHNPPCSRPATLGGNNAPKVPEKGHSQHCKKHNNTQGNGKSGMSLPHNHTGNQVKMTPELLQTKEGRQMLQHVKQANQNNHMCSHLSNHASNNKVTNHLGTLRDPQHGNATSSCPNSSQLPTSVNNVSVGTSTICTEPDCDGNHDNDSFDDNCSEKSSSTSNSTNQKDGKYCDCCYCEFFGHGNPPVAPTSKNYAEMRDKLRLRLKKKVETEPKQDDALTTMRCSNLIQPGKPAPVIQPPPSISPPSQTEDPLETKGLDELIKFINGTEEEEKKPVSTKAAKRARQKQRKLEEKAKQEAEQFRKEQERQRRLQQEEERRRLAEEEERKKNEALLKKQKKQAAKRAKSSSNSPTPTSASSRKSSCDNPQTAAPDQGSKNAKRKGKHKEDLGTLHVNITCEIEHGSEPANPSASIRKPVINSNNNNTVTRQNALKTVANTRPSTEGGHVIGTPPSIDNRIVINSKQNKNKEPQKPTQGKGNGDSAPTSSPMVTINSEHIAQITRQQQELLKKQTQQLIQLKLQQEAKKQFQLAQQQQQQKQQQQQSTTEKGKVNIKIVQNEKPSLQGKITPTVIKANSETPQVPSMKNNVKITVKTSANSTPTNSPRLIEQNNNQRPSATSKTIQQINAENSCINLTPVSQTRKGKKVVEPVAPESLKFPQQLQQQYNIQGVVTSHPATAPATHNHVLQHNGMASSAVKGQVRQPPAGQAQTCDAKTPTMNRKQESPRKDDDSPQSDQGKNTGGKNKKFKRRNKVTDDSNFIDDVFMPKSETDIEGGEMDEFEREIEEFKRFCADSSTPAKREKLQVNVNIKDIFAKKKPGLCS